MAPPQLQRPTSRRRHGGLPRAHAPPMAHAECASRAFSGEAPQPTPAVRWSPPSAAAHAAEPTLWGAFSGRPLGPPPPAPVRPSRGGVVWKAVDGPASLLLLLLAPPCSSNCCQQRHHDHPCCAHLHVGQGTGQGQARRLEPWAVLNKKEKRQSHVRAQSHLPANRLWPPPRPLRHRRRSSQCSRSLWPAC
jgi:hypothetical protein